MSEGIVGSYFVVTSFVFYHVSFVAESQEVRVRIASSLLGNLLETTRYESATKKRNAIAISNNETNCKRTFLLDSITY